MELRQIKYFAALAEELSFTRAAKKLHVSQPPLSFQIASLEAELGTRLFDRTSRSVNLSEAGKAFLPHAKAILARLDDARDHVQRVAAGLEGRVQVGLAGSHFLGRFPAFIQQFRRLRPAIEVALHEMTPAEHLRALRDGRLDVSVSRNPLNDGHISAALLWQDPVVVALPPEHRLATRRRLNLGQLKDEDFVFLRLDSSSFAKRLYEACVQTGFTPRIAQQVVEVQAALNLVAAGLGVALVPASMAALHTNSVCVCALSAAGLHKGKLNGDVYVLWRTADSAPAVAEFKNQLTAWAQALTPALESSTVK